MSRSVGELLSARRLAGGRCAARVRPSPLGGDQTDGLVVAEVVEPDPLDGDVLDASPDG